MNIDYDVIIIGAGAAGLMAGFCAGRKGKKVLIIEHTNKVGEKIRISGGGRCNFTNLNISSNNFICRNPHFVKSALAGYSQYDFIDLIRSYNIDYHEKTLGQLFCDGSSKQIIDMLLDLCAENKIEIKLSCNIQEVYKTDCFKIETDQAIFSSSALVIASGGLSIPKIGASDFGYRIANKFGLKIIPTRPALVPLISHDTQKDLTNDLRGISNYSKVKYKNTVFAENILFTHKGLSGPAILQISSYLDKFEDEKLSIDLLPEIDILALFERDKNSKQNVANYLKDYLANRLVENLASRHPLLSKTLTDLSKQKLADIAKLIHNFQAHIDDSESYLKAEVTAGGVDTDELSSKTMESKKVPGLFFIGEVVDVTGWLGGYNFQWAWSSGFAAGNSFRH